MSLVDVLYVLTSQIFLLSSIRNCPLPHQSVHLEFNTLFLTDCLPLGTLQ